MRRRPRVSARPSCRPVTPSAWHNLAGPEQRSRSATRGPPRRRRIVVSPSRGSSARIRTAAGCPARSVTAFRRSEEHTSELQSRVDLVCRLLLEKKKKKKKKKQKYTTNINKTTDR